eukprot:CAMPEP_0198284214 /NCGR_PEP_ID=MMETSP1449-20131203/3705_1 /TAXON_ID=420275 /ORGANISM="Attheya septentrionalis, Strain CCMP2084" /LENGTH=82 /DNA_ID=CAMNT_0043981171 /DNA_START=55 /DNA_END=299 /DNA_ORIENTATION=+
MRMLKTTASHRHRTHRTIHFAVDVMEMDGGVWVVHTVLIMLGRGLFIVDDLYQEGVGVTGRGVPSSLDTESVVIWILVVGFR